jgi:hypothetical protein
MSAREMLTGQINKLEMLRGYSAYEIAVKNGFEGTETEWLESLQSESTQAAIDAAERAETAADNAEETIETKTATAVSAIEDAEVTAVTEAVGIIKSAESEAVAHIAELADGAYDIVQTMGDSETQVMSQAAVTREVDKTTKLAHNDMGLCDYYNVFKHEATNWATKLETNIAQETNGVRLTATSEGGTIVGCTSTQWGFPIGQRVAIILDVESSATKTASLYVRNNATTTAFSTSTSVLAGNNQIALIAESSTYEMNLLDIRISNCAEGMTLLIKKAIVFPLSDDNFGTDIDYKQLFRHYWMSKNRITNPKEILVMSEIPNSTQAVNTSGGIITITHLAMLDSFSSTCRTDTIEEVENKVIETRIVPNVFGGGTMVITTNTKTYYTEVTYNGI